jgi:hypothetical protein
MARWVNRKGAKSAKDAKVFWVFKTPEDARLDQKAVASARPGWTPAGMALNPG